MLTPKEKFLIINSNITRESKSLTVSGKVDGREVLVTNDTGASHSIIRTGLETDLEQCFMRFLCFISNNFPLTLFFDNI
uniref:Uncharacterized protein n=1 Tax=Megaselia scalaris TaxID=36166 RepID=T1GXC1_MEGSC